MMANTSQAMLEEKYRRAMAFGKYLEQHPDQSTLAKELERALTVYRISLHNVIKDRQEPEPPILKSVQ